LNYIDSNSNGVISREEHATVYRASKENVTQEEIDIDFNEVDIDGDNEISLGEVCSIAYEAD
jgi:Ca2+-binding EF-hand superfamily protein